MKEKISMFKKKSVCKPSVISALRKKAKKDQKKPVKKLGKAEKGSTFAPATAKAFIEIPAGRKDLKKRNFQKKKIRKSLRDSEMLSTFAPRKTRKVH
ncbi:hypothetical protein AAYQ05_21450 [Flavobacterium sp. B11]|uniref:hypothetical protein n=1 Tax=Flavobacterium movens TaxID=214860 RepID=UPI0031D2D2B5